VTEAERTRAAFAALQAVLRDVASSVAGRIEERCPYRARDERCTFAGGCVNQRREARPNAEDGCWIRCGGDQQLRRRGE
jgi:ribosome modulation factor